MIFQTPLILLIFRLKFLSPKVDSNVCAGLRISQGMVMILKMKTTICRDGIELIIGQTFNLFPGLLQGAIKFIVRIVQLIHTEAGFQAILVK